MLRRFLIASTLVLLGLGLTGAMLAGFAALVAYPGLPSLETLTDYRPKIPLRVYTFDGALIGEFGEERREVVRIDEVPLVLRRAILAAEDERFYQHGGVDYVGVLRAAYSNFVAGGARQGASTITMQVARNFFLTKEKTLTRKFNEALLSFKIEHSLTKDQILEIYMNQIYLGQRAYGFAAAAQTYFGKALADINLAEAAMLAGLPKAPSRYNPITSLKRAKARQLYVLTRMRELGYVSEKEVQDAVAAPLLRPGQRIARAESEAEAEHMAELVRQTMVERFGDDAYSRGFKVYTTLLKSHQDAGLAALRKGVLDYDRRHGYRGPEGYIDLSQVNGSPEDVLEDALQEVSETGGLHPAVVLEASGGTLIAYRKGGEKVKVTGAGLKFAQRMLGKQVPPNMQLRRGALIRVQQLDGGVWHVGQLPAVEAGLVSMDPVSGAVRAMVGGFDFWRNRFNHVTQAFRQPGSGLKPFVYSAALEKGFTPASVINDAPLMFDAEQTGSEPWEPKNYDDKYEGPMRMRTALAKSKNLVSIRIIQAISPQYAQDYLTRFGFDAERNPPYLTMALGAGSATPMQVATAYAVFANGGYRVQPYYVERIEDERGNVLARAAPRGAGEGAEQVLDPRNAFIMTSMLRDVVAHGTGIRAMRLGRRDLAGKTGTTNEFVDAWFSGFHPSLVAVSWIGFDSPRTLGKGETGAQAALPIWIDYMAKALQGVPPAEFPVPEGITVARVDPDNGLLQTGQGGIPEFFFQEFVPRAPDEAFAAVGDGRSTTDQIRNQLF